MKAMTKSYFTRWKEIVGNTAIFNVFSFSGTPGYPGGWGWWGVFEQISQLTTGTPRWEGLKEWILENPIT
jgi:hypothetical protein